MLTNDLLLYDIAHDRIRTRIHEAESDRLADQLGARRARLQLVPRRPRFAAARHAVALALRTAAVQLDPCGTSDPGLLIARSH